MSGWRNMTWKLCGAVILLCVVVLVVSPAVNPDSVRDRLSETIRDTTGLRVAFQGTIKPRFFPRLGVEMRHVALLPPLETDGPPLATLDRLDVGVRILPLLGKRIELGLIEIEGLNASLIRFADGRFNLPRPLVKDVRVEGKTLIVTTRDDTVRSIDTTCRGIRLSRSSLRFEDRVAGVTATGSDITLATGPLGGDTPFDARLRFDYALSDPNLSGQIDFSGKIRAVFEAPRFEAREIAASLSARGPGLPVEDARADLAGELFYDQRSELVTARGIRLNMRASGKALPAQPVEASAGLDADIHLRDRRVEARSLVLDLAGTRLGGEIDARLGEPAVQLRGKLSGDEFDPRALCRVLGLSLPSALPPTALTRARLDLAFEATPERARVEGKALRLDDTTFSLTAEGRFAPRPSLEAWIKADTLDLNHYQPLSEQAETAPEHAARAEKPAPLMRAAPPVALSLEVGTLRAGKLLLTEVAARGRARGSGVTVESFRARLYGGHASGTLEADLGRPVPAWSAHADVRSVALAPLLVDLLGKSVLSGRLDTSGDLTAEGLEGKRMLRTLNGKTAIIIAHGAIQGLSLPVATVAGPNGLQSVPFEKAWANVRFTNGVAASTDCNVVAPPNRLLVHGWVNLPARTLSLAAIATLGGTTVPILASGSLDNPAVSVNTQALAKNLLEDVAKAPGALLDVPVDLGKDALDAVGNILGLTKKK
ncbi:AsmA family protein [Fundidesulfovibrio butyratiphilus]